MIKITFFNLGVHLRPAGRFSQAVRGDLVTIECRLAVCVTVPVTGPVANISGFAGSKGSALIGTSSNRIFPAMPTLLLDLPDSEVNPKGLPQVATEHATLNMPNHASRLPHFEQKTWIGNALNPQYRQNRFPTAESSCEGVE